MTNSIDDKEISEMIEDEDEDEDYYSQCPMCGQETFYLNIDIDAMECINCEYRIYVDEIVS